MKKRKMKKTLAVLLALALCIGMLPTSALAAGKKKGHGKDSWQQSSQVQAPAEEPVDGNEEFTSQEGTTTGEVVSNEEGFTDGKQTTVEEPDVNENETLGDEKTQAPEGASDTENTDIEGDLKPESSKTFEQKAENTDVTVAVDAPEGAFPAGTGMAVSASGEDSVKAIANAANADISNVKAVNITFTYNNEKVQPTAPVTVTLKSDLITGTETPVVVHVNDDMKTEIVQDVTVSAGEVSFKADAFSDYGVAIPQNADSEEPADEDLESLENNNADDDKTNYNIVINYVFSNGTTAAQPYTASIAKGTDFNTSVSNPTVVGYTATAPTGYDKNVITVDFTEKVLAFSVIGITKDITLSVVYTPAEVNYTVKYYQQNVDDDHYTLTETVNKKGLTESTVSETYDSEKGRYEGFYGLKFEQPAIAADGSTVVEIYYDRNYYMMSFDLDGGYGVEPVYARYGAAVSVGTPTRAGYSFEGWTDENGNDAQIPATMPAGNTKYKAKWKAADTANVTIVFWGENADDVGYSYMKSSTIQREPGIEFTYSDDGSLDKNLWNFDQSDTVTVAADGSSIVNVYYKRTVKTLTFKYNYSIIRYWNTGEITAKWGADISGQYKEIAEKAGSTFWSAKYGGSSPYTNYFGVMPQTNATYYNRGTTGKNGTMTYWGQDLNGEYTVKLFEVTGVGGYKVTNEDRYEFQGYTYDHGTNNGSSCSGAAFYYTRNSYTLRFNDGYKDIKTESVKYEAPLSTYEDYVPEVPSAYEPGSVTFGGWYLNPECSGDEYKLSEHTMPADNVLLYAKWTPVIHTVKVYKTSALKEQIYSDITVPHGSTVENPPEDPKNGAYVFVGWFYMDNGVEKAFDFKSMPVIKDMVVYAKWSSNTLVTYTISYTLEDGTPIASQTTGQGLAGSSKTFEAKVGEQLEAGYQDGYFPKEASHTIVLDITGENNKYTFIYTQKEAVPYTVKYLDAVTGKPLHDEKVVSNNRKSVVTEYAETIQGYLPDKFQKRLILTIDGENILTFYYTEDNKHAIVSVTHNTINNGITTEYSHTESTEEIGQDYTARALSIDDYRLSSITVNGNAVAAENGQLPEKVTEAVTAAGLNIVFNYTAQYYVVYQSKPNSIISKDVQANQNVTAVNSGYLYGGIYNSNTYSTAYTNICGADFLPTVGTTYYVKEVPDTYLRPTQINTFNRYTNQLRGVYLTSTVDDRNYKEVGFVISGAYNKGESYEKLTIEAGPNSAFEIKELGVKDISKNESGLVVKLDYLTLSGENSYTGVGTSTGTKIIKCYWVTPDGVTVTGCRQRALTIKDTNVDGIITADRETDTNPPVTTPLEVKYTDAKISTRTSKCS